MADRLLHQIPDNELEAALRGLRPTIAWPVAVALPGGPDLAATVRARIETMPDPRRVERTSTVLSGWRSLSWRPARRALVLALVALLAVVAIAGALGLGLPGLRIILGEAPATAPPSVRATLEPGPSPTAEILGGSMNLGDPLDPGDSTALDARAGFPVRWPADPALGAPDAIYVDDAKDGQITLVWATGPDLPATLEPGVGLLLSQFRGTVESGYFNKVVDGGTTVERVRVADRGGFWLSGDPHVFFWEGSDGFVDDPRRWVGDVLLWSDGELTYRIETALGRDEAIRLAESMP